MTRTTQWMGAVSALALGAAPTLALAAPIGTPANQDISNTASVTFTVAGNSSTVTSNPDVFKVDRKLDVVVTTQDSAPVAVALGGANAVTTFTVTNNSNATIDFLLAASQQVGSASKFSGSVNDTVNVQNVRIFVETTGDTTWTSSDTASDRLRAIASGDSVRVYVVSDGPTTGANGAIATVQLTATAAGGVGGTSGQAGTPNTGAALDQTDAATVNGKNSMETVFADAANVDPGVTSDNAKDGKGAARSDYRIGAPVLTVGKYSRIISDPFSGAASPRAIPGAVVEYCIVVNNTGAGSASAVTISDIVPTDLTFAGVSSVYLNGAFNGSETCAATGGTPGTAANWNAGTTTVSHNYGAVGAGEVRSLRFQATIK